MDGWMDRSVLPLQNAALRLFPHIHSVKETKAIFVKEVEKTTYLIRLFLGLRGDHKVMTRVFTTTRFFKVTRV